MTGTPRYACSKCGYPLPSPPPDDPGWTCPNRNGCGGLPTFVTDDPEACVATCEMCEFLRIVRPCAVYDDGEDIRWVCFACLTDTEAGR